MLVKDLIRIFLDNVRQNKKPATHRQYSNRLKPFIDTFGDRDFETLTSLELQDCLNKTNQWPEGHAKAGTPKAPDTQRLNAIALQLLQAFAVEHHVVKEAVLAHIKKPAGRLRERLPTEEETGKILQDAPPEFALIYRGLRQSGARPNELCGLQIDQVAEAKNGCIELVHHKTEGKGGVRRIAIGKKLAEIFRLAIGSRIEGYVFLSPRGRPWTPSNLSAMYRRIRKQKGLPEDLCLYLARHEHATALCRQKGINAAADALGHKNIATTRRYVKPDPEDLKNNQDLMDS